MIAGVILDLFVNLIIKNRNKKIVQQNEEDSEEDEIGHMCEEEHCHCNESGILKSAIHHTLSILVDVYKRQEYGLWPIHRRSFTGHFI